MHLLPPSVPLDAFFASVRRRHPDLDIVVLPTPGPPPAEEPVDEAQLAATLDRVTGAFGRMSAAVLPGHSPTARWSFGPAEGTVTAAARCAVRTADGSGALRTLCGMLADESWRIHRVPGAVERIAGTRDDLRVQASYAAGTGAFFVEVRSEPRCVGKARARRLVRA
ncbi:MAG TPA: hypothetical protein VFY58_11630 [Nocardioides sp.]|nr:hypothetical protein [Nocardioides sp.]